MYYYERWMSGRLEEQVPGLPACVVRAMVKGLDADDLDLLLMHPAGAMAQVRSFLCFWERTRTKELGVLEPGSRR